MIRLGRAREWHNKCPKRWRASSQVAARESAEKQGVAKCDLIFLEHHLNSFENVLYIDTEETKMSQDGSPLCTTRA